MDIFLPGYFLHLLLHLTHFIVCCLPRSFNLTFSAPTMLDVGVIYSRNVEQNPFSYTFIILIKSSDASYALLHFIFLVAVAEVGMLKVALLHLYVDFVCFGCYMWRICIFTSVSLFLKIAMVEINCAVPFSLSSWMSYVANIESHDAFCF